jgi:hypothetical protein
MKLNSPFNYRERAYTEAEMPKEGDGLTKGSSLGYGESNGRGKCDHDIWYENCGRALGNGGGSSDGACTNLGWNRFGGMGRGSGDGKGDVTGSGLTRAYAPI